MGADKPGRRLALALLLLLVGPAIGQALAMETADWQPAINLSDIPGRSIHTTLARDPATSDLFVAWADNGVAQWEEVLGRRWDRATETWLATENLSQSEEWQRDGGPVLSFDSWGHGLLVWTRTYAASQGAPSDGHDVLWRSWDGSTWSPEAILLHGDAYLPGSPGTFGLIPVETPESVLLFIIWGTGYRMAEYQNGTWSALTPWIYLDVFLAQMLMDEEGLIHVAAYGQNSAQWDYNRYFYDAYYLTYDGVNWSDPLNLSFTTGVADSVGMAFDGQGRLHFLWSDPNSPFSDESLKSAIWERVYENGDWTPNAEATAYNPQQAINGFSLAAEVSGTLHLAWSEGIMPGGAHTDLDIRYQAGDGTTWGAEEMVYTSTADSRHPILVVDSEALSLVWQEGSALDQDVYFSRKAIVPPDLCRGVTGVSLTGVVTGTVGTPYTFVAAASPPTATLTLTYTWQASEQPPVVDTGGLANLVDLTWAITGTKTITLTVENCGGVATATHTLLIKAREDDQIYYIYLPTITR